MHVCGCVVPSLWYSGPAPSEVNTVSERLWEQVNKNVYNHKTRYSGDSG